MATAIDGRWLPDGMSLERWEDMDSEERLGITAQNIAQTQLDEQRNTRNLAMSYATPSMEELELLAKELQNFQKTIGLQEQELSRASKIVETIDPNIMESAKQVYSMLKGGSSEFLAPVQQQRTDQRRALEAQLQDQLGSGWQTSTAGQQALAQFDRQTGELLSNARFQAIGQLTGVSQAYSGIRPDIGGRVNQNAALSGQMLSDMAAQRGNLSTRQIAAINATPLTPYVGAQYVGEYTTAQADMGTEAQQRSLWGGIAGGVAGLATGAITKLAGGSK